MNEFHLKCHDLNLKMMALLAISLGLPADFFVFAIKGRSNNLRLLHYPPARRDGSRKRLSPHTDFGTVTLCASGVPRGLRTPAELRTRLWQDATGGLQVTGPDGKWVDVTPQPGTFVVNVYVPLPLPTPTGADSPRFAAATSSSAGRTTSSSPPSTKQSFRRPLQRTSCPTSPRRGCPWRTSAT